MQIRCVAIDDEPLALELLNEHIKKFPALKLIQAFDDAVAAAEFLRNNTIDLLFIDINMPNINGIDLVKMINRKPMIIFTTAYKKFAVEGFELDAVDYLLKPVSFERFSKAINKAIDYYQFKKAPRHTSGESLFVRSEYKMVKVDVDNIEYIENVGDYIKIHLADEKPVLTLMPLKTILEKLPSGKFKRIHRSYIIPIAKVKSIVNRKVRLTAVELPISDSYAEAIEDWIRR